MGIGAVVQQQFHHGDVAGQCRRQERRLSREVHPLQRAGDFQQVVAEWGRFPGAGIYLSAVFQQCRNQRQVRRPIDAIHEGGVVHIQIAHIDGLPQGAAPIPVLSVDGGTLVDQKLCRCRIVVGDRHQQRPDAIGFSLVDAGTVVEQDPGDIDVVVASRVEQWCHAAGYRLAATAVGRHAAAQDAYTETKTRHRVWCHECGGRADQRGGIGISAVLQQEQHDVGVAGPCRKHQRALAIVRIADVDGSAMIDQGIHDFDYAGVSGQHQQRFAAVARGIGVGACLQHRLDLGGVLLLDGQFEWSDAIPVCLIRVGVLFQQQGQTVERALPRGLMQGRVAKGIGGRLRTQHFAGKQQCKVEKVCPWNP